MREEGREVSREEAGKEGRGGRGGPPPAAEVAAAAAVAATDANGSAARRGPRVPLGGATGSEIFLTLF